MLCLSSVVCVQAFHPTGCKRIPESDVLALGALAGLFRLRVFHTNSEDSFRSCVPYVLSSLVSCGRRGAFSVPWSPGTHFSMQEFLGGVGKRMSIAQIQPEPNHVTVGVRQFYCAVRLTLIIIGTGPNYVKGGYGPIV